MGEKHLREINILLIATLNNLGVEGMCLKTIKGRKVINKS
jgi:hypothetical protein